MPTEQADRPETLVLLSVYMSRGECWGGGRGGDVPTEHADCQETLVLPMNMSRSECREGV